jgi:hypothetical protein
MLKTEGSFTEKNPIFKKRIGRMHSDLDPSVAHQQSSWSALVI